MWESGDTSAEIHPVFAFGSDIIDAGSEFTSVTSEAMTKYAEDKLEGLRLKADVPGLRF